jgi:hypothetical protein
MPVIKSRETARIAGALAKAGAKWTPVFRKERDLNGVATGLETRVGCLLGLKYSKGTFSTLKIDVPGTILRTDVPRFEGVMAYNGGEIKKLDEICIKSERHEILDVQAVDQMYYILTLKD